MVHHAQYMDSKAAPFPLRGYCPVGYSTVEYNEYDEARVRVPPPLCTASFVSGMLLRC